ncbi:MGMT family protein [Candidatus Woesearchaeota archaeon]|nr:MAG: MGMT family protein [Candidatus Woesearchaeota archaeon]
MTRTTVFAERVYAACRMIPKGKVSTYGDIARYLNSAPRAVGQALKRNPYAPKVPCHRVVASDGRIGGFMGEASGPEVGRKIRLLKSEGVQVREGRIDGFTGKRRVF